MSVRAEVKARAMSSSIVLLQDKIVSENISDRWQGFMLHELHEAIGIAPLRQLKYNQHCIRQ